MNTPVTTGSNESNAPASANACRIMVIYEGAAAHDKALEMCHRLSTQFGEELEFAFEAWKVAELLDAASARRAAEAAARADILLFSVGGTDLAPEVRIWLESLTAPNIGSDRALAVLFADPVHLPDSSELLVARLREVANRLRMDFLPPMPDTALRSLDALQERVCTVTSVLKDILERPRFDHWGLNE